MKFKVLKAPPGMPIESWAVVSPVSAAVAGFESPEAAHAWATEWNSDKRSIIAPVCLYGPATQALARYERHVQGLEGEEWKG